MIGAGLAATLALAAPFGEPASRPAHGIATCLRATGVPGELVRTSPTGVEFLRADAAGLRPVAELPGDSDQGCAQVASSRAGAGVAATVASDDSSLRNSVRASLREPGGTWSAPAEVIGPSDLTYGRPLAVAASERGDALVAIAETGDSLRIRVARRAPGRAFEPPATVFSGRPPRAGDVTVQAGMSASGEAVVAWSWRPGDTGARELWAALAPPGAPFGTPAKVGDVRLGSPFDLAVGADGRALLAFAGDDQVLVAERAPGGGFAPAAAVGRATDTIAVLPAVAIATAGGTVVAWHALFDGRVDAAVRAGPGAFGPATMVAPPVASGLPRSLGMFYAAFFGFSDTEYGISGSGPDQDAADLRAATLPDARALLTWGGSASRGPITWTAARSATLPLTGGAAEVQTHGSELRDVGSLTPLELAGGAAVAWTTDADHSRDGRLHLAVEGAADAPVPPAPRVRVGRPSTTLLDARESLKLPISCSAACDVYGQAESPRGAGASGTFSLPRAGRGTLVLENGARAPRGRVWVRVRSGAPGARAGRPQSLTVRVRRRSAPPRPRVAGAVARRDGRDVVVTWRTNRRADDNSFVIVASGTPNTEAIALGDASGGPRRFRARVQNSSAARYVSIYSAGEEPAGVRRTLVKIRG